MGIFKKIAHLFGKTEKSAPQSADQRTLPPQEQDTCPVCWGYQEYDHKVRKKYKDKQIDVKNHKNMYLKSKRFVVNYIDGKRYKKAEVTECPSCGKELSAADKSDSDSKR